MGGDNVDVQWYGPNLDAHAGGVAVGFQGHPPLIQYLHDQHDMQGTVLELPSKVLPSVRPLINAAREITQLPLV